MAIWGNHSATQYPDFYNAKINGRPANEVIGDEEWLKKISLPPCNNAAPPLSRRGDFFSRLCSECGCRHGRFAYYRHAIERLAQRGNCSDGSYGVEKGLVSSFPIRVRGGKWEVVQGVPINDFSRAKIDASVAELKEEKSLVGELIP